MKRFNKFISIVLTLCMLLSVFSFDVVAIGVSDVPEGYIGIYTVDDLYNVRNDLTANYILMNDIDLSEATAEGGEYDFIGNGWNPIGSGDTYSNNAFTGIFDGNGYSIVGFRMNVVNEPETLNFTNYYGLFAYNSGEIRNLTMWGSINGGFITKTTSNVTYTSSYCGTFAAYNTGTIKNCTNYCNISINGLEGENTKYLVYCGGITGRNYQGTIEECVNNGNVQNANDSWSHYSGGITAEYINSSSATIKNCYNTGDVSGYYAGGIVAKCTSSTASFLNCYNIGAVKGEKSYAEICNNGNFENCYYRENGIESTQTGVTVLTSEQMKLESSFTGFDFDSVWIIEEGGYPYPQIKNNALADIDFDAIRIKKLPDTTLISYNTELNMFGCIVELLSGEEVVGIRGVTNDMVSGYDKTKLGVQTITVSLNGISTTFDVEVKHHCDIYGHDTDWVTTIKPTETTKGERIKKCLECGKSFEIEEIPVVPVGYIGVYDPESLNSMRDYLGGNYVLLCDVDMTRATAKGGSCDFNGNGWLPIGDTETYGETAFTGSLNGNFHKIIGLRMEIINKTLGGKDQGTIYTGLFSNLNGEVENLYIEDIDFYFDLGTYTYSTSSSNIRNPYLVCFGAVAAKSEGGIIKDVVASGSFASKNPGRFGGVACISKNEVLEITSCISKINFDIIVSYDTNDNLYGEDPFVALGGICYSGKIKVSKCANFGNIYIENKYECPAVAGIIIQNVNGDSYYEISDCYNAGDIVVVSPESDDTFSYKFSGITLYGSTDTVLRCYNIGQIKHSTDGKTWTKGVAINGWKRESYSYSKNCYSLEDVALAVNGAKSLTHEQMLVASNYEGFSFGDVWYFDQNDEEYPYPKLKAHIFGDNCDHSYTDWIIDSEPTCDTVGVKHQFCVLCKDVIVEETPALGHDYFDEFTVEKEGTCSESGIKYRSCSRCTDKVDITIIPPTGHDYSEWNVDVEATCTTAGSQSSTCATCGDVQTAEIAPYGHTYSSRWTTDIAPTCTEAGSKSHHCLRCGDKTDITEIPAKGHDFTDWFVDTPPTCTGTGANYRACKTCGIEELQDVSAKGHTVGEWITELEPTCTEDGLKYQLCSECDTKIYDSITPLGHNYSDSWTIDVEATCTTAGSKSHHCTRCNKRSDITVINAYGHSYSENWTVDIEATCIEDGSKSHHCLRCDDKTDIKSIKATGHSYSTWILDIVPTCTEKGIKYRVCESCKNTETASMEALGHDYSSVWTVDTPATCTENGLKSHHCTRCEDKKDITLISATGHFFGAWNVEKEATCTEIGSKSRTCELCSTIEKDEIQAYGHEYSTQWTIDVEPTCSATGTKSHHCLRCDDKTDVEEIPFGGHIFGKWYVVTEPTMDEAGVRAHKCYNCEMTEEAELPKLLKYTATFVADGDIVATVDFPEDATEIEIPEVPHKDKFNGEWENFDVRNKNFTVNAVYTPISTDDIVGIKANNSADYYSSTGEVEINLNVSAPSKTIVTTTTKAVPLDIIFVLDQSGSMADGGKKNALKNAVSSFSNEILADAIANSVDHRIAVVGFASGSNNNLNYQNTELLTADIVKYNKITNADYKNALVSVNDNGALNKVIADAVKAIDAEGATKADLGLEMASNIFANSPAEGGRQRVVVFLTDGVPTSYSNFEYSVANVAIQNAYQLKNTYDATVYSVGVFDRTTSANRAVNNFMNYVSSNYNEEVVMKKNSKENTENTSGYYLDVSDVDSLSDVFTSIVEETTTHTGRFTNATLKYTLTKHFTLTSVQEDAIRKNAMEKLGVTNEQISITRNADGTTTIVISGVEPWAEGTNYVIDFTFRATANGNTLKSGTYQVGTFESGVVLENGEGYEAVFAPQSVDIGGTSGIAVFNINNIPYAINRLSSTTKVVAPATDFGEDYNFIGWNVPANLTLNNEVRVFDAELLKNEYKISWNIDGEITEVKYAVGDFIAVPEVGNNSIGGAFAGWDKEIPETMPSENLTITAIYDAHYHKYDVTKDFKLCTEGGTLTYTCECGDTYTEEIAPCEHSFAVITASNNQNAIENAGSRCTVCGIKDSKALRLEATATYQMSDASYNTATVELDYVDEQGDNHQPEGDIEISVQLDEVFENDIPENVTASVYRVNEDGSRTKLQSEQNGMNMTFKTDHFSTYEFEFTTGEQKYLFAKKGTEIDYTNKLIFSNTYLAKGFKSLVTYLLPATINANANEYGYFGTGTSIDLSKDGTTDNYKVIINGDLNGDGVCDVLDAAYAALVSSGHKTATEEEIYAANGCVSDEIDVTSYQNVVNMVLAS